MSESFGKSFHITNCKTSIRIDLVWKILKYRASLFQLFMYNFVIM
jgi:hypothetical protein